MQYRTWRLSVAIILGVAGAFAQAPKFIVHDLGPNATVTGINNNGQVVGSTQVQAGVEHAFRTRANKAINLPADDLGTLGGPWSRASGINSSGQVVGSSSNAGGETRGFRTGPNMKINPSTDDVGSLGGPLLSGSFRTEALGINDSGRVVGASSAPSGIIHAFRTEATGAINNATDDIGALLFSPTPANQESVARSINAAGDIGGSFLGGFIMFPDSFIYQGGTITEIPCIIIAPFGNNFTGINDHGQVAGTNACSGSFPPNIAVWQNGTLTDLAACDCEPHGVNNSLQVVGRGFTFGPNHAFLYSGGKLSDLNDLIPSRSRWVLTDASAINDLGQIVGTGQFNGSPHAYRLDPVTTPTDTTDRPF